MIPEKVILFGSYAKGNYKEHRYRTKDGIDNEYISDYDILIVTQNNNNKANVQEGTIMDKVSRYRPPVNLEIHEFDYINKGLEEGEYFFVDIIKDGVLLYERSSQQFSSPRELSSFEKKAKAQRYFDTWFPQSSEFLFGCEMYQQRGNLKTAAFMLHQAAESLYYSTLLVFSDYKPKTHNLWKLRKKAKPYSQDLFEVFLVEADPTDEKLFDLLKRGYVDARYRLDYDIADGELLQLIQKVKRMMEIVNSICTNHIQLLGE